MDIAETVLLYIRYRQYVLKIIRNSKLKTVPEAATRGDYKKGVLKNFTKVTGKRLCQFSFFKKLQA